MKISKTEEVSPERAKKIILEGYRTSFRDPKAASNRTKFVADRIGMSVNTLYKQIRELDLKSEIDALREGAGVSRFGRVAGAKYHCSACGSGKHNARSPKCKYYEAS